MWNNKRGLEYPVLNHQVSLKFPLTYVKLEANNYYATRFSKSDDPGLYPVKHQQPLKVKCTNKT